MTERLDRSEHLVEANAQEIAEPQWQYQGMVQAVSAMTHANTSLYAKG